MTFTLTREPYRVGQVAGYVHLQVKAGSVRIAPTKRELQSGIAAEIGGLEYAAGADVHMIPWRGEVWIVADADSTIAEVLLVPWTQNAA